MSKYFTIVINNCKQAKTIILFMVKLVTGENDTDLYCFVLFYGLEPGLINIHALYNYILQTSAIPTAPSGGNR